MILETSCIKYLTPFIFYLCRQLTEFSSYFFLRFDGDMVLLLVSDPQILGYQREPPFPIGYFTRWDADRYDVFNLFKTM